MDTGFRSHRRGASARLRKTFRYPSEDEADDGNALEVMDEQGMSLLRFRSFAPLHFKILGYIQNHCAFWSTFPSIIFTLSSLLLLLIFRSHLHISHSTRPTPSLKFLTSHPFPFPLPPPQVIHRY